MCHAKEMHGYLDKVTFIIYSLLFIRSDSGTFNDCTQCNRSCIKNIKREVTGFPITRKTLTR